MNEISNKINNKKEEVSLEIADLLEIKSMAISKLIVSFLVSLTLYIIPYFYSESTVGMITHTIIGIVGFSLFFWLFSIFSILKSLKTRIIELIQIFYRLKSEVLEEIADVNANKVDIAKEIINEYFIPSITAIITKQIPLFGKWLSKKIVGLFESSTKPNISPNLIIESQNSSPTITQEQSKANIKFLSLFNKLIVPFQWGVVIACLFWLIEFWLL